MPGLEIAGAVEAVAPDVTGLRPGQRVAIEPVVTCSRCAACRRGRYNCCAELRLLGVHLPGRLAELVAVPAERAHPLPDDLSPQLGALVEPFSIGAQAVERAQVAADDTVVLLGAGVIGLTVLPLARSRGARVLVVEPNPGRRTLALELGAEAACTEPANAAGPVVAEFTAGEGASVVEATGQPEAMAATTALAAPAGRIAIVGVTSQPVPFAALEILRKELDHFGVRNSRDRYPEVVDFVAANRPLAERLISRTFGFSDVVDAFAYVDTAEATILRAVMAGMRV
ncbi:MAG: alcohol dehydrogenase catalytic domain-containing protein [Chloroflexi bacterium]|nr:alcohol dehydrogenase catalytic domain-containing protein [Chloroflexota bacterium]